MLRRNTLFRNADAGAGAGGAPSPAPAPVAAPASAPEPTPGNASEDVEAVLAFDPFADKPQSDEGKDRTAPAPAPTDGGIPPEPVKPPTPAPSSAPAVGGDQELRTQLAQLSAELAALKSAPSKPAAPEGDKPQGPEEPSYAFQIPDELVKAMASEDPSERKHATTALISGASKVVHRTVMAEVGKIFQQMPQMVHSVIRAHAEQQEIFNDFYNTFKEFNQPQFHALVRETAASVMKETGQTTWSPQLRDAIGSRVRQFIAAAVGGAPVPTPSPVPQPPTQFSRGPSPRPAPAPRDQAADVAEVLGLG